jgi:hypothetical protein
MEWRKTRTDRVPDGMVIGDPLRLANMTVTVLAADTCADIIRFRLAIPEKEASTLCSPVVVAPATVIVVVTCDPLANGDAGAHVFVVLTAFAPDVENVPMFI